MILSWLSNLDGPDLDDIYKLLEDAKGNNVRLLSLPSHINLDGDRVIIIWSGSPNTSDDDLIAELEFHLDEDGYDAEEEQNSV